MPGLPETPAAVAVGDVGADESFREMRARGEQIQYLERTSAGDRLAQAATGLRCDQGRGVGTNQPSTDMFGDSY